MMWYESLMLVAACLSAFWAWEIGQKYKETLLLEFLLKL